VISGNSGLSITFACHRKDYAYRQILGINEAMVLRNANTINNANVFIATDAPPDLLVGKSVAYLIAAGPPTASPDFAVNINSAHCVVQRAFCEVKFRVHQHCGYAFLLVVFPINSLYKFASAFNFTA
jgi:hypothetical protein